jgi:putative ABC transport system permease protein
MPNWGFVWMVAWPDFRARLQRFLVIGLGMALVLAITLLLSAFSEGFRLRSERLLDVFGGDRFLVAEGASGPMTSSTRLPTELMDLFTQAGIEARPLFFTPNAVEIAGAPASVVVVGTTGDEPGLRLTAGHLVGGPGQALTDEALVELKLGDQFVLAGHEFTVVGTVEHATWDIATAGLFIERETASEILAGGQDVLTAIAIEGNAALPPLPEGITVHSRSEAFEDILSRTADAKRSIDSFKFTLWVLAIVIVGAVLYLAAIERVRDFAIFKATGASNTDLVLGLGLQAAIVGVIAGVLSIGLAQLMKPIYPGLLSLPFTLAWPVVPVSVVIAVLSSIVGVRRAIKVDPSQAFG